MKYKRGQRHKLESGYKWKVCWGFWGWLNEKEAFLFPAWLDIYSSYILEFASDVTAQHRGPEVRDLLCYLHEFCQTSCLLFGPIKLDFLTVNRESVILLWRFLEEIIFVINHIYNRVHMQQIKGPRYADDSTLMAESEEELTSLLMKVKEERGKVGLKLNIQKTKIMASGPITSWH